MIKRALLPLVLLLSAWVTAATAQEPSPRVVDLPTRPGVSQRLAIFGADDARATVILFAGGHGGLQLAPDGAIGWGQGNFLVRTRQAFAAQGLRVVLIDAPSDRQSAPFLSGFRQTPEHAADVRAAIAWARQSARHPVWLVGTSRGTQSAAYVATRLAGSTDAPDGLVLTSTILSDDKGRPVPGLPLDKLAMPVLVVHHERDGCHHCAYADMPRLMDKLQHLPRRELMSLTGGVDRGDPCEAAGHHGFAGLEAEVVPKISRWVLGP